MPNVLAIGTSQKASGSKIRIPCDFGDIEILKLSFLLGLGYTISSYAITAAPSGLTISDAQVDYTLDGVAYQISAMVDGGVAGTDYTLSYAITLDDPNGTEITASGTLKVI